MIFWLFLHSTYSNSKLACSPHLSLTFAYIYAFLLFYSFPLLTDYALFYSTFQEIFIYLSRILIVTTQIYAQQKLRNFTGFHAAD
jgi:hypothetical protein